VEPSTTDPAFERHQIHILTRSASSSVNWATRPGLQGAGCLTLIKKAYRTAMTAPPLAHRVSIDNPIHGEAR
jgi:hypothetical protein